MKLKKQDTSVSAVKGLGAQALRVRTGNTRKEATEDEATRKRIVVREAYEACHGTTLAETSDSDARSRDTLCNLVRDQLVHHVSRLHRALLVLGSLGRKPLDVCPCRHLCAHVDRDRAVGGIWKDPLDPWHLQLWSMRRPAMARIACALPGDYILSRGPLLSDHVTHGGLITESSRTQSMEPDHRS